MAYCICIVLTFERVVESVKEVRDSLCLFGDVVENLTTIMAHRERERERAIPPPNTFLIKNHQTEKKKSQKLGGNSSKRQFTGNRIPGRKGWGSQRSILCMMYATDIVGDENLAAVARVGHTSRLVHARPTVQRGRVRDPSHRCLNSTRQDKKITL